MWAVAGVAGLLAVALGLLPPADAYQVAVTRGGPIMAFLVAITVLAELAESAGVFAAAARGCARAAAGSTPRLFALVAALAVVVTAGMSLDTTAVLLTPVVLDLAERSGRRPQPFALLVVWLSATASLLLPGSNLTNLLAVQREQVSAVDFAVRMAMPELATVGVTVAYLWWLYRRDLTGRYEVPGREGPDDRVTFWVLAVACAAVGPGILAGLPPWAVALPGAVVAVVVVALRDRRQLRARLVPWRIVVLTEGLFLVVEAVSGHGLTALLTAAVGSSPLRTVVTAAAASNLVNNLPAYLAVEGAVGRGHLTLLLAALVGADAGPLVTLWASLATLLWRERCLARGVKIGAGRFALVGLGGVPLVLLAGWAALVATS